MSTLVNNTLNTNQGAGTAVFTSITGVAANVLTPAGKYNLVKVFLDPPTAGVNLVLNALWMGHQGGANAFSFDGNQKQLKVGGSGTITIVTSGAQVICDPVAFQLDTTKALLFAYDGASNASARDVHRLTVSNWTVYFGGGTQGSDASVQNKSGYSSQASTEDIIARIDAVSLLRASLSSPIIG